MKNVGRLALFFAVISFAFSLGVWLMKVSPNCQPKPAAAAVVDQRRFYQQKDGTWIERVEPNPFDSDRLTAWIDITGGIHLNKESLSNSQLQRIASQLLKEATK